MADIYSFVKKLEQLVTERIKIAKGEEQLDFYALKNFVSSLAEKLTNLQAMQAKLVELQEQLAQLGEPPLQYGIFLSMLSPKDAGNSPKNGEQDSRQVIWEQLEHMLKKAEESEASPNEKENWQAMHDILKEARSQVSVKHDLIVGVHGQRYEVNLVAKGIAPENLKEGQEVVLNKTMNVVDVRGQYMRGDTVEVVNVISPPGTAKVISIPEQGEKVQVQWAGGDKSEKFEVVCSPDLRPLRRGDIVRIDESGQNAIARVKPRLHVRSGSSEGVVVEISDHLFKEGVDIGDIVRVDTQLQFAFEKLPSYETGGLALEKVPDVTFEDIGGLDDQIEEIRDAIELPYLHRKLYDEYQLPRTKGIMLYGPPGCGKTMIAKAIANSLTQSIRNHLQRLERHIQLYLRLQKKQDKEELRRLAEELRVSEVDSENPEKSLQHVLAEELRVSEVDLENPKESLQHTQDVLRREGGIRSFFLNIKGPELLSKWVGESEHRIRKIFEEAKRNATFYTPVIIFFDEMEAMFRTRGSGLSSDVETTIVPQFLSEMDGVEASENVIIIGASNRHDMIDPAIMRPGRLDVKVKVPRPSREAAIAILALSLTPDLPLLANGLKQQPDNISCTLTFPLPVVKRTLQAQKKLSPEKFAEVIGTIPNRCDFRHALATNQEFRKSLNNNKINDLVDEVAKREQLAEAMIVETVDLLFSPASQLEAITSTGKHRNYPLREFVSGALLASVVTRAKKAAVKRRASPEGTEGGIAVADLRAALKEEFEENAEQLATQALEQELLPRIPGHPSETVQFVEVHLAEEEDPWSIEKAKPYQAKGLPEPVDSRKV